LAPILFASGLALLEHFRAKWVAVRVKKMRQIKNLEHFRAKWIAVRVKKMRQTKNLEPFPNSIKAGRALGLGLALSLAGCGSTERMVVSSIPQDDYQIRHPIVLGEEPRTLQILVEPQSGRFDHHSALQLREFATLYRKFGSGPITVSPPAFPNATPSVQPIRQALERAGVRAHMIVAPYPAGPNLAAPVRLSFLGLKASVAYQCGQWPRDLGIGSGVEADWSNKPYWNFGCAYQTAFAAQVADPRDLVSPQAEAPQDTAMRTRAVDNREHGLDPSTWRPSISSINGIGGSMQ